MGRDCCINSLELLALGGLDGDLLGDGGLQGQRLPHRQQPNTNKQNKIKLFNPNISVWLCVVVCGCVWLCGFVCGMCVVGYVGV